jgi:hypothetical protein
MNNPEMPISSDGISGRVDVAVGIPTLSLIVARSLLLRAASAVGVMGSRRLEEVFKARGEVLGSEIKRRLG